MTIGRRIGITAGVLMISVLGIAIVLFWSSYQVGHGIKQSQGSSRIVRSTFLLRTLIDEYLVDGHRRPLRQWNKNNEIIKQILNDKDLWSSADPILIANLKETFRKVDVLSRQAMQLRASQDDEEYKDDVSAKMKIVSGLLYRSLEELAKAADDLSLAVLSETMTKWTRVQMIIVGTMLSMGIIILTNIFVIRRSIVRPLKALAAGAEKIGVGNFDHIMEVTSDDEVGKLAQAFSLMIENLKEREMELRHSEEKFRSIFENSPLGLVHCDAQGIVTTCNDSFVRIIGTPRENMIGLDCMRDLNDEKLTEAVIEALAGRTGHYEGEYTSLITNKTVHIRSDIAPIVGYDGSVNGAIGLYEDVSVRLRMEKELRESEEKYRRLHETMRDAFVIVDMTGSIQEVNQAYQDMLGYSSEELRSLTYVDLTPEKWHSIEAGIVRDQILPKGYSDIYEKEYRKKDGTILPVELRTFLMRDEVGTPYSMWAIVRDVSQRKQNEAAIRDLNKNLERRVRERTAELSAEIEERKQIEKALRESEGKYKALYEASGDGILLMDRNGAILDANRASLYMFGYSLDEIRGTKIKDLIHPEDFEIVPYRFQELLIGEFLRVDRRMRKKNGSYVTVEIIGTRIEENLFQGIYRDITERIQMQDLLRTRAGELTESNEQLLRSNKDLEQFAYVASHDLQEPLRTVTSALQMFEKEHRGKFGKRSDQLIDFAVGGAKKMQSLIRDLLAYSRLNARESFGAADMKEVLDESTENLRSLIGEKNSHITYDEMPTISGDPVQLVQLLQNLIGNALKFGPATSPKVHVSARKDGHEWVFSVKDNGIGIQEKYFEKIFVIFQQLSKKGPVDGTGIGLAIAKKIVERHCGRIWVESEIGVGSTFYFTIPDRIGEKETIS